MSLYSASQPAMAVTNTMTTLLEINPIASRVATIVQWSVEFTGVSATDVPVIVQVCEITAASASGTGVTAVPLRDGQVAVSTLAKDLPATEGTAVVLETHNIPPSSGIVIQYPLGREPQIQGAGSSAKGFSIRANRGSGAAINACVTIEFEE